MHGYLLLACSIWWATLASSSFSSLCHKISRQRSQETALIMEQLRWWIRFSISVGGPCNHACSKGSHWTRHCTKILEMENGQQVKELNHTSLLCKWKLSIIQCQCIICDTCIKLSLNEFHLNLVKKAGLFVAFNNWCIGKAVWNGKYFWYISKF